MNCPGCNRNNAFNLSICPSCGAMTNDTVREELLPKISKPMKMEIKDKTPISGKLNLPPIAAAASTIGKELTIAAKKEIQPRPPLVSSGAAAAVAAPKKSVSEPPAFEIAAAKPTAASPNLVEFHSKNSSVPEWRLQLQNAVRRRCDRETAAALTKNLDAPAAAAPRRTQLVTSGANALKAEIVAEKQPARVKNPTLNSALKRIEESRQKFLAAEAEAVAELSAATASAPRPASKNFPLYLASKQTEVTAKTAERDAPASFLAARPKLAESSSASINTESGDLDTNKLPPLPLLSAAARLAPANLVKNPPAAAPEIAAKAESKNLIAEEKPKIEIKPLEQIEINTDDEPIETEIDGEFEDCAPYSMRFNAGVFDLIIGGFSSLLVLSPFMLTGENWFTFTGLLAFLATCSIVMFIYLTATIGYYGRTFGMRLFALEIVDIEGEHYPTLHQAAVSSAVYILSLALGGIGFLTLPFNEDRRAAHDLASGTIVVREN